MFNCVFKENNYLMTKFKIQPDISKCSLSNFKDIFKRDIYVLLINWMNNVS